MEMTLQTRLEQLLEAYSHHYDIERNVMVEDGCFPAMAIYYMRDENYAFSKKIVLSALEQHEYAYFFLTDHLDVQTLQQQVERSMKAGSSLVKPHKEHMCSYVSLVILADTIDPEAKKMIQKMRFRKNFRLSLHGWMEYHIAAMECSTQSFLSNPAGKGVRKTLELNFGTKVK